MKKRIILCAISVVLSLSCLTSCVHPPHTYKNENKAHDFNYEVIGEMIENYITNKYGIDCEMDEAISYSFGGDKYVRAWFKTSNDDNAYMIEVYPETDEDSDGDGYFDSYYIKSEAYYRYYISAMSSEWAEQLVSEYTQFTNYRVFGFIGYTDYINDLIPPTNIDCILDKKDKAKCSIYIMLSEENYSPETDFSFETNILVDYLNNLDIHYEVTVDVYNKDTFKKVSDIETYYDYSGSSRKYNYINRYNIKK